MKRTMSALFASSALAFALALAPAPAQAQAQAVVNGVPLGATCKLFDSRLGPGTPVVLNWDTTLLAGWSGTANGIIYRLERPDMGQVISNLNVLVANIQRANQGLPLLPIGPFVGESLIDGGEPAADWSITLEVPAARYYEAVRQIIGPPGGGSIRFVGFVPSSGPILSAYGVTLDQPRGLTITITP